MHIVGGYFLIWHVVSKVAKSFGMQIFQATVFWMFQFLIWKSIYGIACVQCVHKITILKLLVSTRKEGCIESKLGLQVNLLSHHEDVCKTVCWVIVIFSPTWKKLSELHSFWYLPKFGPLSFLYWESGYRIY